MDIWVRISAIFPVRVRASTDRSLVEIVEIKDHPWFLGCQFHPEFTSRPMNPHPLFREFIRAAVANKKPELEP